MQILLLLAAAKVRMKQDSVVILSPAVKHLKMTGEDDSPKEESDSKESSDDEDDGGGGDKSSSERERHEIDWAESDEEEGTGDEEEEELIMCAPCGGTPCIWQQLGQEVIGHGVHNEWLDPNANDHSFDILRFNGMSQDELDQVHLDHKHRHFVSYQTFNTAWAEGGRGRGDARKLPQCCEDQIHHLYPVPPGHTLTGFRSSEERGLLDTL